MNDEYTYLIKNAHGYHKADVRKMTVVKMENTCPVFQFTDKPRQSCSQSLNSIAEDLRKWDFLMHVYKSHIINLRLVTEMNKKQGAKYKNGTWYKIARDKYELAFERWKNL